MLNMSTWEEEENKVVISLNYQTMILDFLDVKLFDRDSGKN